MLVGVHMGWQPSFEEDQERGQGTERGERVSKVRFGSTGHEYEVIEEGDSNCWCMTQHNKHRYSIIDEMTGVSIITTLEADCCGRILRRETRFGGNE